MSFKDGELQGIAADAENGKAAAVRIIESAPPINEEDRFYWDRFHELCTARQTGMGFGPIPVTAFMDYACASERQAGRQAQERLIAVSR